MKGDSTFETVRRRAKAARKGLSAGKTPELPELSRNSPETESNSSKRREGTTRNISKGLSLQDNEPSPTLLDVVTASSGNSEATWNMPELTPLGPGDIHHNIVDRALAPVQFATYLQQ